MFYKMKFHARDNFLLIMTYFVVRTHARRNEKEIEIKTLKL